MASSERRKRERRKRAVALRYPERRTGFDPRRPSPLFEHLRDNRALLLGFLVALNLFSLADWLLTMRAMSIGAVEGNPVLAGIMGYDVALAGVFKFAVILGVSLLVWRGRAFRAVLATLVVSLGLYLAVIVYHVTGLAVFAAI